MPPCVFLLLGLLVQYAYCQKPLSAATNQTTPLQPMAVPSPRGTSPNRARFHANGTVAGAGMAGIGALGAGKSLGNSKISNEDQSNKNLNRLLKKNRLKPPRGGGVRGGAGDESEDEVPIGLPPFDVNAADFATPPPPPFHNFPAGSVNGASFPPPPPGAPGSAAGGTFTRPSGVDRKNYKNKFTALMNAGPPSQFHQGKVYNNSSNSQMQRTKFDKFRELRNMTRQSTANLPGHYSKQEPHINILPVKSNQAMPPNVGQSPVELDEAEGPSQTDDLFPGPDDSGGGGNSDDFLRRDLVVTDEDPVTYHPKYKDHHDFDDEPLGNWEVKNDTGSSPLKKIKSRFNMDNVRNLPLNARLLIVFNYN